MPTSLVLIMVDFVCSAYKTVYKGMLKRHWYVKVYGDAINILGFVHPEHSCTSPISQEWHIWIADTVLNPDQDNI